MSLQMYFILLHGRRLYRITDVVGGLMISGAYQHARNDDHAVCDVCKVAVRSPIVPCGHS